MDHPRARILLVPINLAEHLDLIFLNIRDILLFCDAVDAALSDSALSDLVVGVVSSTRRLNTITFRQLLFLWPTLSDAEYFTSLQPFTVSIPQIPADTRPFCLFNNSDADYLQSLADGGIDFTARFLPPHTTAEDVVSFFTGGSQPFLQELRFPHFPFNYQTQQNALYLKAIAVPLPDDPLITLAPDRHNFGSLRPSLFTFSNHVCWYCGRNHQSVAHAAFATRRDRRAFNATGKSITEMNNINCEWSFSTCWTPSSPSFLILIGSFGFLRELLWLYSDPGPARLEAGSWDGPDLHGSLSGELGLSAGWMQSCSWGYLSGCYCAYPQCFTPTSPRTCSCSSSFPQASQRQGQAAGLCSTEGNPPWGSFPLIESLGLRVPSFWLSSISPCAHSVSFVTSWSLLFYWSYGNCFLFYQSYYVLDSWRFSLVFFHRFDCFSDLTICIHNFILGTVLKYYVHLVVVPRCVSDSFTNSNTCVAPSHSVLCLYFCEDIAQAHKNPCLCRDGLFTFPYG